MWAKRPITSRVLIANVYLAQRNWTCQHCNLSSFKIQFTESAFLISKNMYTQIMTEIKQSQATIFIFQIPVPEDWGGNKKTSKQKLLSKAYNQTNNTLVSANTVQVKINIIKYIYMFSFHKISRVTLALKTTIKSGNFADERTLYPRIYRADIYYYA